MELTLEKATKKYTPTQANHLIEGRDIVVMGLQPWYYDIGSNCKNIAAQLAKHNRVFIH